jgi:beta-galactosidase
MDTGYFTGDICNYTKYVFVPKECEDGCVGLLFDGAMMNATVDVNGCKAATQHYGYAPFYVDLTKLVEFGAENRITVNVNTSMQPNSRWYSGSGLYRGVKLLHAPKIHIVPDGIYAYTKEVADGYAFLETLVEVQNDTTDNRMVEVEVVLVREDDADEVPVAGAKRVIQVEANSRETARQAITLENPLLGMLIPRTCTA